MGDRERRTQRCQRGPDRPRGGRGDVRRDDRAGQCSPRLRAGAPLELPDTSLEGAVVAAEKLREELTRIAIPGILTGLSASFGVAGFPSDAFDPDALVRVADRALYAAKARGRNCVISAADLYADDSLATTATG